MLSVRQNRYRLLPSCDDGKVASIRRQHVPAIALGAGDNGSVGESQTQVGVAMDESVDAREILCAAIKRVSAPM
jgi:hypothetical protein